MLRRTGAEGTGAGRISLYIAKGIWAFLVVTAIALLSLYWIKWPALFFLLVFLIPLMKFVPIAAALGLYFGFKESEEDDEREARIGMVFNAAAFVVGAIYFLVKGA